MTEYQASHRMLSLIADNTLILMALSRFNIPLGFGDATVEEVCRAGAVDCHTFLAVANFISDKSPRTPHPVSLPALMGYLKNAHDYFLNFILPTIRRKIIDAINQSGADGNLTVLILQFYDEYVEEVRRHMEYENEHVFSYVDGLLAGRASDSFSIGRFEATHKPIAFKLKELKDIFIRHFRTNTSAGIDLLNSALFDIITCERDLLSHCRVEDEIFVPAVMELEEKITSHAPEHPAGEPHTAGTTELTEREKEIIRHVAMGLSNKEIADRLNLSVHTVTTHRRNISAKLEIHSSAGITIYAIIHKLIDIPQVHARMESRG